MPRGWQWDPTLFAGSAAYYTRGRLPYPAALPDAFAAAAKLTGAPRLIDAGCGPGTVALMLAPRFADVVGVDPDTDMLVEAERLAGERGIANARWLRARAEELPADLGRFRYATFAQSFHWMERERVAAATFALLEPGGAFVHVNTVVEATAAAPDPLPHPAPPGGAIRRIGERYLGAERRAGRGVLRHGTPGDEWDVLRAAGFRPPRALRVPGGAPLARSADDIVAHVYSSSASAPHLFGDRLADFEPELRAALATASPSGVFSERIGDVELVFYERPSPRASVQPLSSRSPAPPRSPRARARRDRRRRTSCAARRSRAVRLGGGAERCARAGAARSG